MNKIKSIYFAYKYDDNDDYKNKSDVFNERDKPYNELCKLLETTTDRDLQNEIDDLINWLSSEEEEKGFIMGFLYASKLWKDCN